MRSKDICLLDRLRDRCFDAMFVIRNRLTFMLTERDGCDQHCGAVAGASGRIGYFSPEKCGSPGTG